MPTKYRLVGFLLMALLSCDATDNTSQTDGTYPDLVVVGAMKDVMWQGRLQASIRLDSIANRRGLYGLGPESYLTGEVLVKNGQAYVSRVLTDSTMTVIKTFDASAPFFVYGHVQEWEAQELPRHIRGIKDLEKFIDQNTKDQKRPFAFRLAGRVVRAGIHVQNLPPGTKVSSPAEAHQGQINYRLQDEQVEIVGFFSTEHKGIFTHHDSYLHMHLITTNEERMGHLDDVEFGEIRLFLPKR